MNIAVTGSHGFFGRHLVPVLRHRGHSVIRLVRHSPATAEEAEWKPDRPDPIPAMNGLDALVHLGGAGLAARRWTPTRMARIRDSRVEGTRNLIHGLRGLLDPPRTILCASATGYYGDRGDEPVDEAADAGHGFLADVCRDWEDAACNNAPAGSRLARLRFGMVLAANGGALTNMLPVFRLGLGGPLAGGRFFMSWIDLDDACAAVVHLLEDPTLGGAFNLTAPHPVRNREFTRALGRALRRPAPWPIPACALRLLYGRISDEVLVKGAKVLPVRLQASGFRFDYPGIESCLRHCVGTPD